MLWNADHLSLILFSSPGIYQVKWCVSGRNWRTRVTLTRRRRSWSDSSTTSFLTSCSTMLKQRHATFSWKRNCSTNWNNMSTSLHFQESVFTWRGLMFKKLIVHNTRHLVWLWVFLFSVVPYVPDPENVNLLKATLSIYRKFDQFADALLVAIQLNDFKLIQDIYKSCTDQWVWRVVRWHFCFLVFKKSKTKQCSPVDGWKNLHY